MTRYVFMTTVVLASWIATQTAQAAEEPFGPFNLQSGHVTSNSGSGRTAHRDQCYQAPSDRFFKEGSWKAVVISAHGRNAYCNPISVERMSITFTSADGISVPVEVAKKFCFAAHAETGSGELNRGKTAWIECDISAVQVEFRK